MAGETSGKARNRLALIREIGDRSRQGGHSPGAIPSWRRIEMLRERRALMAALDDPLTGLQAPDEQIFLADSLEAGRYFMAGDDALIGPEEDSDDPDPDQADPD